MKYAAFSGVVSVAVLMQGCALQQKVDHRETGGVTQVGVVQEAELKDPAEEYKGLESVGVLRLNQDAVRVKTARRTAENAILREGDLTAAKKALGQVLYQIPGNSTAMLLMDQLTTDPKSFARTNGFDIDHANATYTVKRNDTLQRIAYRAYGSSNYYPYLMRLNKLPNGDLQVGQTLIVPVSEKHNARKVNQAKVKIKPQQTKVETDPITVNTEPRDQTASTEQGVEAPTQNTDQGVDQTAENAQGNNDQDLQSDLGAQDNQVSGDQTAVEPDPKPVVTVSPEQAGIDAYNAGQSLKAYKLLKQTANLSPQGQNILAQLTDTLVDQPYQRGLKYYQDQKLNLAIDEFDKVLSAKPDHGQAKVYRARCKKLLDKLSNIE
jgi:LysM repeat protein